MSVIILHLMTLNLITTIRLIVVALFTTHIAILLVTLILGVFIIVDGLELELHSVHELSSLFLSL